MIALLWALALAGLALAAGAFTLGLYLGERGRRIDAQRIAGVARGLEPDIRVEEDPEYVALDRVKEEEVRELAARISEAEDVPMDKAKVAAQQILDSLDNWTPEVS